MSAVLLVSALALLAANRIVIGSLRRGDLLLAALLGSALVARLLVGAINSTYGPLPGAEVDAVYYETLAQSITEEFHRTGSLALEVGREGYSSLLAIFFIIGGYHQMIAPLVNALFFIEFCFIVYGLVERWSSRRTARLLVAFSCFYPTVLLYTSVPLREAQLLWGLALFVSGVAAYYEGDSLPVNWRVLLGFGWLVWLHDGFAVVLFLIPITMWFKYNHRSVALRLIVGGIMGALVLFGFLQLDFLFRKLPEDPSKLLDAEFFADLRMRKTSYGVAYGEISPTWGSLLKQLPVMVFAFLAAPFPLWARSPMDLAKMAEGILYLSTSVAALASIAWIRSRPRRRRAAMVLAWFGFLVVVFALGTGNTGIAARHRAKFVWMPALVLSIAGFRTRAADAPGEPGERGTIREHGHTEASAREAPT